MHAKLTCFYNKKKKTHRQRVTVLQITRQSCYSFSNVTQLTLVTVFSLSFLSILAETHRTINSSLLK